MDRKLGELGDQIEARTREIHSTVNAQFAELHAKGDDAALEAALDDAQASAAEAAAEIAADVESRAAKVKKAAKDAASD
jgi:hypothetical protein